MIEDSVKIHDNFSLEVKLIYETISKKKYTEYNTTTYLFIPYGLHINHQTYTKSKFYDDVKVYIRYNASKYTLDDILYLKSGPLKQLIRIVKKIQQSNIQKINPLELESRIKMLGAILNYTLKTNVTFLKSQGNSGKKLDADYLVKLQKLLEIYRRLISKVESSQLENDFKKVFKYGDEYCSNITSYYLIELLDYFKSLNIDNEELTQIAQFIKDEQEHRKTHNYDITTKDDYYDETLLYNRSQLKKYIEGVLFLNRDVRKDGAFLEQTIFATAAGLAMILSTALAFYSQQFYGKSTWPFFIVLVIAYILRDRIKKQIELLFIRKASSFFYDYKIKIKDPENNLIGKIKENFTFVPFKKLGYKVKMNRYQSEFLNTDYDLQNEQIVQYKKKIVIYPKKFGKEISDNRLNSIVDITRINLHRIINQMDDPKKQYSILKKGNIINRVGNKVYYIYVVQELYSENGIEFKRYRVIMNRKGIKRIEKVEL